MGSAVRCGANCGHGDTSPLEPLRNLHLEFRVRLEVRDEIGVGQRKMFHRSPASPEEEISAPSRIDVPDEPARATQPSWNAVVSGIVSGVAIASFSGHWYFAMFAAVTATVTATSWLARVVRARRRGREWTMVRARAEACFAEECNRIARAHARRRQRCHPAIEVVREQIVSGGEWFWQARSLDRVRIGAGLRAITLVPGAPNVALDGVPILVDVAPGAVVGVHGGRALEVVRAIIVRVAARVGPSDLQLSVIGESPTVRDGAVNLPHHVHTIRGGDLAPTFSGRINVLVLSDPALLVRNSPLMHMYETTDTTILIWTRNRDELPALCSTIIDADDDEVEGIGHDMFDSICREIGVWIDPDLDSGNIPDEVGFLDLVPGEDLSVETIHRHWLERRGFGPRIDVGIGIDGTVSIDLDRDGPHGVIIGTTGSGKSEVLRQIVASMSLNGSPEDVTFVLVDYKGGSAFDACARLPHVVGVITDLDENMVERVLCGLEAELRRREGILRSVQARDVNDYRRRFDSSENEVQVAEGLPRLVLVIDELAALRSEVPDFVPTLASIAQRGRSLGVHLIAATQRAAALSADVMANASLRMSLRVHDRSDSISVLGSDRAAFIDHSRPGRSFVKVGSQGILEVQACLVSDVLANVVARIEESSVGRASPRRPWLDPLPRLLARSVEHGPGVVGIVDDIRCQSQSAWCFDPDGHVLVVGGVGRTNVLRTIFRSLERRDEGVVPDVIVVSCRPGVGDGFEGADWRIELSDYERLARLLKLCEERIAGQSSDRTIDDSLVLMIDDLDVWRRQSMTDRVTAGLWDALERVIVAGRTAGITCIATSAADGNLPSSLRSRMDATWVGTQRAGVFRVVDRSRCGDVDVQIFWDPPQAPRSRALSPRTSSALRRLPTIVQRNVHGSEFAIRADTLERLSVDFAETMRFIVIGNKGSGVTTALEALGQSWSAAHPRGRVIFMSDGVRSVDSIDPITSNIADVIGDPGDDRSILLVIDDVHRHVPQQSFMTQLVSDAALSGRLSIVVGATASFIRSHSDHWIQQVRRARTGVLLARSAVDCDLLGVHSLPIDVHPDAPGRGLLVDGGSVMGVVQFVVGGDPEC